MPKPDVEPRVSMRATTHKNSAEWQPKKILEKYKCYEGSMAYQEAKVLAIETHRFGRMMGIAVS